MQQLKTPPRRLARSEVIGFGVLLPLAARQSVVSAISDATKYRTLSSQENIWDTEQPGQ